MGVVTLLKFLVGDREAILRIAGDRHALWVGLVFVLSAGLAREYDGEDLLHEPWYVFIPLGASLVAATLLFVMVHCWTHRGSWIPPWPSSSAYLSFLGLFWMTAPLAWLYAIPYERFLSAQAAVDMNLATLGVVAVWRVALMIRVVAVCTTMPVLGAVGAVLLFSSIVVVIAGYVQWMTGAAVIDVMGGLRDEGPDRRVGMGLTVVAVAFFSSPLWTILARTNQGRGGFRIDEGAGPSTPSRGLTLLAWGSVLVWVAVLPFTQPEQQRRRDFERATNAEDYRAAAGVLLDRPREAFPPHWNPSEVTLAVSFLGRPMRTVRMLEALHAQGGPEWAISLYSRALTQHIEARSIYDDPNHLHILAEEMWRVPEGRALLEEARALKKPPEPRRDEAPETADAKWRAIGRYENLRAILDIIEKKKQ